MPSSRGMIKAGSLVPKAMAELKAKAKKAKKEKPPKPKVWEFSQLLPYVFTPKELAEISHKMAENVRNLGIKEEQFTQAAKQAKTEIGQIQVEITSAAEKIGQAKEFRMIQCRGVINYAKDTRTTTRIDTGEVLESGPIPPHERQFSVPGVEGQPSPVSGA